MLTREQKEEIVKELISEFGSQNFAFFNFENITSQEIAELKLKAKKEHLKAKVIKRKLIEIAFKKLNIKSELPQGHYLCITSQKDEILPFKFVAQFIKEKERGSFQGGIFEKNFIDKVEAEKIANLPSKEELKAKLVYVLNSPLWSIYNSISYNLRGLLNILKQKATEA